MHEKDPLSYGWLTYAWVIILSLWGGTAHTIRKIRSGELKRFSLSEWIGDMVLSGFIGVITFYLCEYAGIEQPLTAFLVAISAHQGTKAIMFFEKQVVEKINKFS